MKPEIEPNKNLHRDPIDGASKNHPVGTGTGALGGALAGAAIGSAAGPMGSLTGAMIGTVAGAIAGKGIAEGINPEAEDQYWSGRYKDESYYKPGYSFDDYGPAYRFGRQRYLPDTAFESADESLGAHWPNERGSSRLTWEEARNAAKASWDRVHHTYPK